jgi:hypothetical protein
MKNPIRKYGNIETLFRPRFASGKIKYRRSGPNQPYFRHLGLRTGLALLLLFALQANSSAVSDQENALAQSPD